MASVYQINVSQGGVPKLPVDSVEIKERGLAGDRQAKPGVHGGKWKAVSLFSREVIQRMAAEGHSISPGAAGENLTIEGLEWSCLKPGDRLRVGDQVELKITSYATPCAAMQPLLKDGDITHLLHKDNPGRSRLYTQVTQGGTVHRGDPVTLMDS